MRFPVGREGWAWVQETDPGRAAPVAGTGLCAPAPCRDYRRRLLGDVGAMPRAGADPLATLR